MSTPLSNALLRHPQHDLDETRRFLKALDPSASKFTFQFFWDDKERRARKEPSPRGMNGLTHDFTTDKLCTFVTKWNNAGCPMGSFITINETTLEGSRREKDIRRVRAVFIDIDENLARVEAALSQFPLKPSAVIESSPGKAQVYWFVQGEFPTDQFKRVQEALIKHFGTDPNVNDLCRVMRAPGTLHCKGEPYLVRIKALDGERRYTLEQIARTLSQTSPSGPAASSAPAAAAQLVGNASEGTSNVIQELFPARAPISGYSL